MNKGGIFMKNICKKILALNFIAILCVLIVFSTNATNGCSHSTKNGICDLCKAIIIEVGNSVGIQCKTNAKGEWVEYSDIISIPEIGSASTSIGGFVNCTMSATIKGDKVGEADLYLLVEGTNQILGQ